MQKHTIYGLPLNPMPALEQLKGASFCVSYGTRKKLGKQLDQAIDLVGQDGILLVDNGAFSAWKSGVDTMNDEAYLEGFATWANDILDRCPQAIAVIPDVIDGTEEQNAQLIRETTMLFDDTDRVMPVWHMHESLGYLTYLCESFNYIAIGSSGAYANPKTTIWQERITEVFNAIDGWEQASEGAYVRPRIHMMRAQAQHHLFDFDSSDSTNVAMNHKRAARRGSSIAQTAARINDRIQASAGPEAEHQSKRPLDAHVQAYNEDLARATAPDATEADIWMFNYRHGELPVQPSPPKAPVIVSYGVGVDSTAVLVGMHQRGETPDLILFADTGDEKPETYAYIPVINRWLASVGFPQVTIVKNARPKAGDVSLSASLLRLGTLPALAYGGHQCSLVWKRDPQVAFVSGKGQFRKQGAWEPAAAAWARGELVTFCIGYDAGPRDSCRSYKAEGKASPGFANRFPLIEWGWDREECKRQIAAAGLPVPVKSACFHCPASKKSEIDWLADMHPELAARAVLIERTAQAKGLKRIKGLGRNFAWANHLQQQGLNY